MPWHGGHGKSASKTHSISGRKKGAMPGADVSWIRWGLAPGVILSLGLALKRDAQSCKLNRCEVCAHLLLCWCGLGHAARSAGPLSQESGLGRAPTPFLPHTHKNKDSITSKRLPWPLHTPEGEMWMHMQPHNNPLRLQTCLINKTHKSPAEKLSGSTILWKLFDKLTLVSPVSLRQTISMFYQCADDSHVRPEDRGLHMKALHPVRVHPIPVGMQVPLCFLCLDGPNGSDCQFRCRFTSSVRKSGKFYCCGNFSITGSQKKIVELLG